MNNKKNTPHILVDLLGNKKEVRDGEVGNATRANVAVQGTLNDVVAMLVSLGNALDDINVPKKLALAGLLAGLNSKPGEEVDVDLENFVIDIMGLLLDL